MSTAPQHVGSLAIVLHSHLPWVSGHGRWPVGEEWLYAAWAQSYIPVVDVLTRLGGEGRRDLLTLGVTPVLANSLDDPSCMTGMREWAADWQLRAHRLAGHSDQHLRDHAVHEHRAAAAVTSSLEGPWSAGGSPPIRALADGGVVELLGGPATHTFAPLLPDWYVRYGLDVGADDLAVRWGRRTRGIWAPECGYRPGLENIYAEAGVSHLVVDGPTLLRADASTSAGHQLGASDVVAFGRDLDITYRVWSPRRGYPGGRWYRDFHTWHHASGTRPYRVTSRTDDRKAAYEPQRAALAMHADVADFVGAVRARLIEHRERDGRAGLVVVAYDTELFGHWWHEGPQWLEHVLREMPIAGIRLTTLAGAVDDGLVGAPVSPASGSWGTGKDWRVWEGELADDNAGLVDRVRKSLQSLMNRDSTITQQRGYDALLRQTLLATSSDWAFMIAKDSAANYARARHDAHHREATLLLRSLEFDYRPRAASLDDRLLPYLDARRAAQLAEDLG